MNVRDNKNLSCIKVNQDQLDNISSKTSWFKDSWSDYSINCGFIVAGGNGTGLGLNKLELPSGIALDSSGNLYIADQSNHRVMKYFRN